MVRLFFGYSNKLIALVLALAIIPTIAISSYMYTDKITRETNNIQQQLKSVSQIGTTTTQDHLEQQKKLISYIANNQLVIAETKKINGYTDINELFRSRFALMKQFSVILNQNDLLKQLMISDSETGDVLFHTGLFFPEGNLSNEKHFQDAVDGKISVSEVYQSLAPIRNEYGIYEQGIPTLLVSAPIRGEVGIEGVLTARLDAFKIIPESNYRGSSFSNLDIYAVNSEGYFLTKPLFLNDMLGLNLIKKRPELALQAIDPQLNRFNRNFPLAEDPVLNVDGYENYLGNTVIGSIAPIRGTSWYYVVEVDKNEAYENIVLTRNSLLMYTSISLVIVIIISVLFARRLVNPIKKLTEITKLASSGNFDVSIDPKLKRTQNEIGILATQFDYMRQNIKKANEELLARHNDLLLNEQMLYLENKKTRELAKKLQKLNREVQIDKLKYEELYEGSPDLYRTIDKNGIIVNCNKSYASNLGYSKEEVIGRSVFEHVSEESTEALQSSFETWQRYGKVLNREVILKRKDGTTFPTLVSATNLYDNNGNVIGSNTIIKDMSEIQRYKNLAEELRNLDRAKEEFSSMVAHELKTPLVPILLYAELLLGEKLGSLTPMQKKKLEIMYDSAKSLSELVQDVLDVHKLELGRIRFEMYKTRIKELIDACVNRFKPIAQAKNVKLIDNVDSASLIIQCDRERIIQVLNNLVNNALRFVAENDGQVVISATERNGSIIFSVKDNGIGIQRDKQRRLFKKFYQVDMSHTRSGGSGLGLAICKGIVDAHGGKIWCRSAEDKGSAFYFSIPIQANSEILERCRV